MVVYKGKKISFGGRIVLLNFVLGSVPLFYFSFYIAPKLIIKELTAIQRRFILGKQDYVD